MILLLLELERCLQWLRFNGIHIVQVFSNFTRSKLFLEFKLHTPMIRIRKLTLDELREVDYISETWMLETSSSFIVATYKPTRFKWKLQDGWPLIVDHIILISKLLIIFANLLVKLEKWTWRLRCKQRSWMRIISIKRPATHADLINLFVYCHSHEHHCIMHISCSLFKCFGLKS